MSDVVVIKLVAPATTAPTGAGDTVLFDTSNQGGKRWPQMAGLAELVVAVTHSHDGTFVLEKSTDRGATWAKVEPNRAAAAATQPSNEAYNIEPYDDFRLVWNQGAVTQTTWVPSIALSCGKVKVPA
jgi:hypothetical protein